MASILRGQRRHTSPACDHQDGAHVAALCFTEMRSASVLASALGAKDPGMNEGLAGGAAALALSPALVSTHSAYEVQR
jgi:hypothetical protein